MSLPIHTTAGNHAGPSLGAVWRSMRRRHAPSRRSSGPSRCRRFAGKLWSGNERDRRWCFAGPWQARRLHRRIGQCPTLHAMRCADTQPIKEGLLDHSGFAFRKHHLPTRSIRPGSNSPQILDALSFPRSFRREGARRNGRALILTAL